MTIMKDKIFLIDLDGTMYRGDTIIEGAKQFVDHLIENKREFLFLTNNARRTSIQNVEHMEKMGFTGIKPEHFFTSSMAAAAHIAKKDKTHKRCNYVGEEGLKEALIRQNFTICEEEVDYLFVGLDINATYKTYSKALKYLLKGAKLVGTNSDRLLAKDDGFNVGNGSVVAMFEHATNQKSEQIGKPYEPILLEALAYLGKTKEECAILGDNLETDIKLGVDYGVDTIFVISGVHTLKDINKLEIEPTITISNLKELIS